MLTNIAKITNNYINTGHSQPITVLLEFCGTTRVVGSDGVCACESLDCEKDYWDLQGLVIDEKHTKHWKETVRVSSDTPLGTPIDILSIKPHNLRTIECKIERHPLYAVARAWLMYDLIIVYVENHTYKLKHAKNLTTCVFQSLEAVPPADAYCIFTYRIRVLDWFTLDCSHQPR